MDNEQLEWLAGEEETVELPEPDENEAFDNMFQETEPDLNKKTTGLLDSYFLEDDLYELRKLEEDLILNS